MTPEDLFEILVRDHADSLRVYLRCTIRDPALIEDIFQETLIVAWKRLDDFDKSRPFGPWLRGIAGRLVLAARRKQAKGMVLCDQNILEHLEQRVSELGQQPGDTLQEKLDGLRECIQHLPERYREAVKLRYQEELAGPALAERLQITGENLKKRLQRGRERLLDCMQRKRMTATADN